ncbi:ArsR family transcriptional regulator [Patescibacteria group bacterium]|nr:ArsR family transcriptional regulator [Patescibacteria group bacterium]MBU1472614.1 ArsR family transcriptional regulator [Patescibacteria group bacterium]MBU2459865.1 ArsR family transcriptional regulator [Patescibacteria group bacterium]MBU2544074.1 ArsR family transcriptional regulator [Patescibacteria group bacterium]
MLIGKRLRDKSSLFAQRLRAVAHPHRLAILYFLAHDPQEVRDLSIQLDLSASLIVHHLKKMTIAGWAKRVKQGSRVTYEIEEGAPVSLVETFLKDTPFTRFVLERRKE